MGQIKVSNVGFHHASYSPFYRKFEINKRYMQTNLSKVHFPVLQSDMGPLCVSCRILRTMPHETSGSRKDNYPKKLHVI